MCVEVEDTGLGIPPDCVPRIFDRFFRVRDERTRHVLGTGLGLPIVKGIVEAHLGAVEVDSTPGQGSTLQSAHPRGRRDQSQAQGNPRDGGRSSLADGSCLAGGEFGSTQ